MAIYDVTVDGERSLHRQFLGTSDGTILEVFGEVGREVGWQLGESLNALMQAESGGRVGVGGGKKGKDIFAGLMPAVMAQAKSEAKVAQSAGASADSEKEGGGGGI